jgi:hypothetical protein
VGSMWRPRPLTPDADFTPFLQPTVDESVKRAALKKLFTDPHFNVMDGLDTYIDDYSKPDPIPESMLRQMTQSQVLGLFDHEDEKKDQKDADSAQTRPEASPDGEAAQELTPSVPVNEAVPVDEDPDLRLQQDDAAGPGGAREGPGA